MFGSWKFAMEPKPPPHCLLLLFLATAAASSSPSSSSSSSPKGSTNSYFSPFHSISPNKSFFPTVLFWKLERGSERSSNSISLEPKQYLRRRDIVWVIVGREGLLSWKKSPQSRTASQLCSSRPNLRHSSKAMKLSCLRIGSRSM